MRNSPNAGEWFHDQFVMLMRNAKPPLDQAPSYEPRVAPPQVAEAAAPPSASRPPMAMTQEGDFTFSYDEAAETAPEGADQQSVKSSATPKRVTKPAGARAASPPAPPQLPPLSVAQITKLAVIAVTAATLVALGWNALCPAQRAEPSSPSRSRRRLRSERLRRVSEDGVESSL